MLQDGRLNESQKFIRLETFGAKFLLGTALLALFLSNSAWRVSYDRFFHDSFISFVINDGLMTIFFLVVGLEVKYEILKGSLRSMRQAAMPAIGAIGGMIVPAGIYILFNYHDVFLLRGWAVSTATDVAFSLAILSFLGTRIKVGLKAYLTALAIFDDIAAIVIIAFFYTNRLETIFLGLAVLCLLILFILNQLKIHWMSIYFLIGTVLWFVLLKAGIHPTLSGVLLAFMIPIENERNQKPLLQNMQHHLHPWVALVILPLFALANAGVSLERFHSDHFHFTVACGAFLGLFLGKPLGIFGASWLAVKYHVAAMPDRMRWRELCALSVVCGIGFTISLLIGELAFGGSAAGYLNSIKIGVLAGSLLSGVVGYLLLLTTTNRTQS